AIYYLEKGESVFVAAHTSAGKTVVVEYAFALASKHCTRAVYTAPIKTISNQKYRDFCGKFDVGLLTRDVSLRPEASCLIMTTEILRSMLYRGADIICGIEWPLISLKYYGIVTLLILIIADYLMTSVLVQVIIFCFSKNRCDNSADNMTGTDHTNSSEKSEIRVFCDSIFPAKGIRQEPTSGIGVHHAGLLPIVKEVVEMLFCRGVVKFCCLTFISLFLLVLFSTETFAMGVNAPARTVVFDTFRKFDGKEFRQLLPGDYTQMAGRAGRRGLDKIGTVVLLCGDEIPEEKDLKHVEDMLKRSFAEFHAQMKLPKQQQLLMRKLAQPTKTIECIKGEPEIEEYYERYSEAELYSNLVSEAVMQFPASQSFLTPGRVVVMKSASAQNHLLGVILKAPSLTIKNYIVLVLTPDLPSTLQTPLDSDDRQSKRSTDLQMLIPKARRGLEDDYYSSSTSRRGSGVIKIKLPHCGNAAGRNYEVREIDSKELLAICNCKLKIDQAGLLEDVNSAAFSKTIQHLLEKSDGNKYPPALDPVRDRLLQKMAQNKCHGCIKLEEHIKLAKEVKRHKDKVNALKFEMSDEALQQMPDFQGRIDVLKEICCIDFDLVVQIKGRVACEMNSGEELICAECLFENQLDDLEPEEAVAIMSAFVFQQNTSEPSLTPKLAMARKRLDAFFHG
ncbi:hypothetical protein RJ639_041007, partial [Escallonia herrerae]